MTAIPVPVSSSPGVVAQEGAGRLINCFAEKTEQGARYPVIWRRCSSMHEIGDTDSATHIHLRGGILSDSTLVLVFDTRVYAGTFAADLVTLTNLGALAGTDHVTVAQNNAATPDIVCVSTSGCFNLFTGAAPTSFADADLPAPNSVSELDGYFVWTIGDGRIFASDLNAVTVNALSFATEQSLGGLLRGVTFKGEFFAFGPKGCGVYKNSGLSPFPLERRFTIEKGIIGTHAIAGWERGWVGQLLWVADDGVVYRMNGYVPEPVSNDDVTRIISGSIQDGEGTSFEATVYMQGRHAMWRLTNPGVWTWEYNVTTGNWHERKSYNRDDCRGAAIIRAFNLWVQGDRTTGKLAHLDEHTFTEFGDPLVMEIVTGPVANFPARIIIPRVDFDFTSAVGISSGSDPIQTDPRVEISWSRDGGYSYGNPVLRELGSEGVSDQRVTVQRVGLTNGKGMRFKLLISDNVHVGFLGGQVPANVLAAQ